MTHRSYVITSLLIWTPPVALGFVVPMAWHERWPPDCPRDVCMVTLVLKPDYLRFVFVPYFALSGVVMTSVYACIIRTAKRHAADIMTLAKSVTLTPPDVTSTPDSKSDTAAEVTRRKKSQHDMRLAKTCVFVLGTFYVCWVPLVLIVSVQTFGGRETDAAWNNARLASMVLAGLGSAVNPVIYAFRIDEFRREYRKIVCTATRRS